MIVLRANQNKALINPNLAIMDRYNFIIIFATEYRNIFEHRQNSKVLKTFIQIQNTYSGYIKDYRVNMTARDWEQLTWPYPARND